MNENPMDMQREARIRAAYIDRYGKSGVRGLARVSMKSALNAVETGDEMLLMISIGGLRVVTDLLADAYDMDTTPYEVLMLETLQSATEDEYDDE